MIQTEDEDNEELPLENDSFDSTADAQPVVEAAPFTPEPTLPAVLSPKPADAQVIEIEDTPCKQELPHSPEEMPAEDSQPIQGSSMEDSQDSLLRDTTQKLQKLSFEGGENQVSSDVPGKAVTEKPKPERIAEIEQKQKQLAELKKALSEAKKKETAMILGFVQLVFIFRCCFLA